MIDYITTHYDDLGKATLEHLQLVLVTLIISLVIAACFTVICNYSGKIAVLLLGLFSMVYSIPSLALFALLIPLTGLGKPQQLLCL